MIGPLPRELNLTHAGLECAVGAWCRKTERRPVSLPAVRSVGLWLYVARRLSDGILKVGVSINPASRVHGLCHGNRCGFVPLGLVPQATVLHEATLLRILSRYALPGGREWFRDCAATRLFAWQVIAARDEAAASDIFYGKAA